MRSVIATAANEHGCSITRNNKNHSVIGTSLLGIVSMIGESEISLEINLNETESDHGIIGAT